MSAYFYLKMANKGSVKILGIVGSPRKRSNTEILVKKALEGTKWVATVDAEMVLLRNKNIQLCKGCYDICYFKKIRCPIHDDMEELLVKLLKADGYIFGSPTYFGGVSGLMRIFMDRTVPIFGKLKDKIAGIVSVGDGKFGGQELAAQSIRTFCLNHSMILAEWHVSGTAGKRGEILNDIDVLEKARKMGQNIARIAVILHSKMTP